MARAKGLFVTRHRKRGLPSAAILRRQIRLDTDRARLVFALVGVNFPGSLLRKGAAGRKGASAIVPWPVRQLRFLIRVVN